MEYSPPEDPQSTLTKRPRKRWILHLGNLAWIILAVVIGSGLIYVLSLPKGYKIPTGSMEPTLVIGDHIIALGFMGNPELERGDLVVFQFPHERKKEFISRIVGLPGETLEIRRQKVFINGQPLNESYVQHTAPPLQESPNQRDDLAPLVIPEGQVFVLGDNRENSLDSRQFGFVSVENIRRKVRWIYWSWDGDEETVRWERIGKSIE